MLKSLASVREDVNFRMTLSDYNSTDESEGTSLESSTVLNQIHQKIHPERVAINTEELLKLVENDDLQKASSNSQNPDSGT